MWQTDAGMVCELSKRPPELDDLDKFVAMHRMVEPGKARFAGRTEQFLVPDASLWTDPVSTHCERCTGRVLNVTAPDVVEALATHRTTIIAGSPAPQR